MENGTLSRHTGVFLRVFNFFCLDETNENAME
jgi:hypothetical protein